MPGFGYRHAKGARVRRAFAAVLGVWFLLVMIEPEAVHSCAVHTPAAAASHGDHHSAAGHENDGDEKGAQCSCPGDCAAGAHQVLPGHREGVGATIISRASAQYARDGSCEPTHAEFLLPFAIGPPASLPV